MRKHVTQRRRLGAVAVAVTLAFAAVMQWGSGPARAEEEEEVPLDTKLMRQFLKDLGLQRDGQAVIQYRERAPLVVPPSRNLPPPQDASTVARNPAWPKDKDADSKQRRVDTIKKPHRTTSDAMIADGRPIPRDELDRAGKLPAGTQAGGSLSPEDGSRRLTPAEMGENKSIFSGMFSSLRKGGETANFMGEPPRTSLTAPPPGYQTPSPNQPYGVGAETNKKKAMTLEERTTPSNSQ